MADGRRSWDVTRLLGLARPGADTSEGPHEAGERRLAELSLESIFPNPFQPRQHFGEAELEELARSIGEVGVIQPLVVRSTGKDRFELIAGERRLRASRLAGLETVPAVVIDATPEQQELLALVENLQRRDLTAVEEARSFEGIMQRTGWTQTELARRLGRAQSSVANKLRLLNLEPSVQDMVCQGTLGERHARALLPLAPEEQVRMAGRVLDEGLTVKDLERRVKTPVPARKRPARGGVPDPSKFSALEGELLQDLMDLTALFREKGLPLVLKVNENQGKQMTFEMRINRNS